MKLTGLEALSGLLAGFASFATAIGFALRWVYLQGVASAKLVSAIDKLSLRIDINTDATGKLSESFGKFTEETNGSLVDHEHRLTVLETRMPPPGGH